MRSDRFPAPPSVPGKFFARFLPLSFFAFAACAGISDDYSNGSLRNGIPYSEAQCRSHPSSVTVVPAETAMPYCVRYQLLGGPIQTPIGVALIPGDLVGFLARYSDGQIVGEEYAPSPATSDLDLRARLLRRIRADEQDIGRIFYLARPGTMGSSGRHADEVGAMNEVIILDLALDELKRQYGIARWVLVGQSGGAAIAAMLMTRRDDIEGVVLASGSLDKKRLHILRGHRLETWNAARNYDPIDHVTEVPSYLNGRIVIFGDVDDRQVPFEIQRRFHDALAEAGIRSVLVEGDSLGTYNHRLLPEAYALAVEILESNCREGDATSSPCFLVQP